MEYRTTAELQRVAEIHPVPRQARMSREERLMRWAELLGKDPGRELQTLRGTEFCPLDERYRMRSEASPLTIAFEDQTLRKQGLLNDTYGEAIRFFELTDRQLHRVLCHCHF